MLDQKKQMEERAKDQDRVDKEQKMERNQLQASVDLQNRPGTRNMLGAHGP